MGFVDEVVYSGVMCGVRNFISFNRVFFIRCVGIRDMTNFCRSSFVINRVILWVVIK